MIAYRKWFGYVKAAFTFFKAMRQDAKRCEYMRSKSGDPDKFNYEIDKAMRKEAGK